MNVNWSILVPGPGGVLIPTYGNYGGPGYSDGEVLAYPTQPVDYSSPPADALDALFEAHDKAYDSPDLLVRAQGDLALLDGISKLPNGQLDPEASVYAGFATLLFIQQLTMVNGHPELLSEAAAIRYTRGALHDIEHGLAKLNASDRDALQNWLEETATSIGGPVADEVVGLLRAVDLHGFEAHIGDLHLAGPKLAEAVDETLALLFTAGQTFDFTDAHHLSGGQPRPGAGLSEYLTEQAASHVAVTLSQPEHGAALATVAAGVSSLEQHKHFALDDLLI